jgi:hypothetical protein
MASVAIELNFSPKSRFSPTNTSKAGMPSRLIGLYRNAIAVSGVATSSSTPWSTRIMRW